MNLYIMLLPVTDNAGHTTRQAHERFEAFVVDLIGGITVDDAVCFGKWHDDAGKRYNDMLIRYAIACDGNQWDAIKSQALHLFPDQLSIFTARIGEAELIERKQESA